MRWLLTLPVLGSLLECFHIGIYGHDHSIINMTNFITHPKIQISSSKFHLYFNWVASYFLSFWFSLFLFCFFFMVHLIIITVLKLMANMVTGNGTSRKWKIQAWLSSLMVFPGEKDQADIEGWDSGNLCQTIATELFTFSTVVTNIIYLCLVILVTWCWHHGIWGL